MMRGSNCSHRSVQCISQPLQISAHFFLLLSLSAPKREKDKDRERERNRERRGMGWGSEYWHATVIIWTTSIFFFTYLPIFLPIYLLGFHFFSITTNLYIIKKKNPTLSLSPSLFLSVLQLSKRLLHHLATKIISILSYTYGAACGIMVYTHWDSDRNFKGSYSLIVWM